MVFSFFKLTHIGSKKMLEDKKEKAATNVDITSTVGVTANGAFGAAGSASLGLTEDTKGNVGISFTINGGGGFPSAGVGAFLSVNNAPTIYEQSGPGTTVGASGGPWAVAVGGEYNILINEEENCVYHGATFSGTVGLYPTIIEVHGEVGYTWVWGFNIYDVAISLADFMLKW